MHALNNLVQDSTFNEVMLAEIAHDLDERERSFTGGAGLAPESGEVSALGGTGNVRADGFFSVQVLLEALTRVTALAAIPIRSESARDALARPTAEVGFICNRSQHWFPIRRLGGVWFDLNSMLPTPKALSDTHLQMYLQQNIAEGYSIYVVRGSFPHTPFDGGREGEVKARQAAADCSAAERGGAGAAGAKAEPVVVAFSGAGQSLGGDGATGGGAAPTAIDPDLLAAAQDDPELAAAIAASLGDAPASAAAPVLSEAEQREEMRKKRLARFG